MKSSNFCLTPWMVIRRGHYIYHFTQWIYSGIMDYRLAGKRLDETIFYEEDGAYPVQCISYHYIRELLRAVSFSDGDVFVDVGCAWGRLIGYMRLHTRIHRFIGVELNHKVALEAQKIFRDDPCVNIIEGNILENLPLEGTVFYLFNPFNEVVLGQFLDLLERRATHSVKILYLYPTCEKVFTQRSNRWRVLFSSSLRPPFMGSLDLVVYELIFP